MIGYNHPDADISAASFFNVVNKLIVTMWTMWRSGDLKVNADLAKLESVLTDQLHHKLTGIRPTDGKMESYAGSDDYGAYKAMIKHAVMFYRDLTSQPVDVKFLFGSSLFEEEYK
jgi:hypothetical protein